MNKKPEDTSVSLVLALGGVAIFLLAAFTNITVLEPVRILTAALGFGFDPWYVWWNR